LVLSAAASFTTSGSISGTIDWDEVESPETSASLWLSLEGSGVGTPFVALTTATSLAVSGCDSGIGNGVGSSLGVNMGEGRCEIVSGIVSVVVVSVPAPEFPVPKATFKLLLEVPVRSPGLWQPGAVPNSVLSSFCAVLSMALGGKLMNVAFRPSRERVLPTTLNNLKGSIE